jgi:predicted ATPase
MRIYALTGRRQRAMAQYHLLRESMRREFEDEPDDDTRRLYQDILTRRLGAEETREAAPAARRAEAPRAAGNLPLQLTSFVGRERELREVDGLLRRHRLLTLTGPGGAGKTRLAIEAAAGGLREMAGGVWLVELAGVTDGALVAPATAAALGVESRSARPSEQAIAAHIGERAMLIVLDNCEHLVAACARVAQTLLTACPNLRILATSREPLHVAGEVDWRVPSLGRSEAVQLFAERAASVSSRFALTEENADVVGEVCRRVDGIPLAIELAAARVGVLAPAQIAERLRDSLSVLAARSRGALTRQQTLVATLDWSYELLDADERVLLRRLGTFSGSYDLEAIEVVCDGDLDVLGHLVDKSLVVVEEEEGTARYRLLDTVRHYARERLGQAGERDALEERHRAHYLALAERLEPELDAPEVRRRLARDDDELRGALRSALRADPETALRLAAALWRFWHDRGDRTEGARWLERALAAAPEPSRERAGVLHGLSVLALRIGDHERAMARSTETVDYHRTAGDARALADELHHIGTMAWVFADYDAAERWCEEGRAVARDAGAAGILASIVHTLGVVAGSRSEFAAARELIERSVELLRVLPGADEPLLLGVGLGFGRVPVAGSVRPRMFLEQTFVTARRVGPAGAVPYALCNLAVAARDVGDRPAARAALDESLRLFRAGGDGLGAAQALAMLGNLLAMGGEHELARELHDESLAIREEAADARGIGLSLIAGATTASLAGELDRAWKSAQRGLEIFERTDDGPGRAAVTMELGCLAVESGRPEAYVLLERALELWRAFVPRVGWCGVLQLELADLDAARGASEQAAERRRDARRIFAGVGDRTGIEWSDRALNAALTPE